MIIRGPTSVLLQEQSNDQITLTPKISSSILPVFELIPGYSFQCCLWFLFDYSEIRLGKLGRQEVKFTNESSFFGPELGGMRSLASYSLQSSPAD